MGCNQSDYVSMYRVFHESGLKKYIFKQNNYSNMVEGVWVRFPPASSGSQSWVEWGQGYAGGVGGEGAKN